MLNHSFQCYIIPLTIQEFLSIREPLTVSILVVDGAYGAFWHLSIQVFKFKYLNIQAFEHSGI